MRSAKVLIPSKREAVAAAGSGDDGPAAGGSCSILNNAVASVPGPFTEVHFTWRNQPFKKN